MSDETIELWTERGVPISETIKRICERDMRDCMLAQKWLRPLFPDDTLRKVCEMADNLRSTAKVFSFMPFSKPGNEMPDTIVELMALFTEAYVRAADECFPRPSNN